MDSRHRVVFGRFEWRPAQRLLLDAGQPTPIKGRAVDLLQALIDSRDRVVTKAELLDRVWGDTVVEEANLPVQVSALRKVLGPGAIATVPGRGYRFTAAIDGDAPAAAAPPPAAAPPALIGRDDELGALIGLVTTQRLVCVVGTGGIGKTRLAQAAAAALAQAWPDPVAWVDGASVFDAAQLPEVVAQALRLPPGDKRSAAGIAAALQGRRQLLVLDNCEHVVEAAAGIAGALRAVPGVHLLVTSQERLNLPDERLFRLPSLALPAAGEPADERFGAVRLFVERARTVDRAFALDAANRNAIGDICRALDGLPLAIELAAARVRQLGVTALRDRLGDRLRLLVGGARDALPQHRTLRAALEWSHALLSPAEQRVLRRLGVFVGGFTLELAQQVVADDAEPSAADGSVDAWAVLDALGALVDRSMVAVDAGEPPRYRLLETMRLFALEQLERHGELARWRERHALAINALFVGAEATMSGDAQVLSLDDALRPVLPEIDNARAALEWALAAGSHRLAIELAGSAARPFMRCGAVLELLPTMRVLLPHLDTAALSAQVTLLNRLGSYGRQIGIATDEVRRIKSLAVERARAAGQQRPLHAALTSFGWGMAMEGELDAARAALAEAIGLEREDDSSWQRVPRLWLQVKLAEMTEDFEAVIAAAREANSILELIPSEPIALAIGESNLRLVLCAVGRFDEAVAVGRRALGRPGRPRAVPHEILSMLMPLAATGAADEAEALLRGRRAEIERHPATVLQYAVEGLAMLAAARGRFDDALRILAEQQRRQDAEGKPFNALTLAVRERVFERCRAAGHDDNSAPPSRLGGPLLDGLGLLRLSLGPVAGTHA